MKNGSVCKMENIMKTISVWIGNIVRKWITDEDAIPLKVASATVSLIDANFESPGQLLLNSELNIKINQIFWLRFEKCPTGFSQVAPSDISKGQFCRMKGF